MAYKHFVSCALARRNVSAFAFVKGAHIQFSCHSPFHIIYPTLWPQTNTDGATVFVIRQSANKQKGRGASCEKREKGKTK